MLQHLFSPPPPPTPPLLVTKLHRLPPHTSRPLSPLSTMTRFSRALHILAAVAICLSAWWSAASAAVAEDDVRCLRGVKSSLQDPGGKLGSWDFTNTTVGFICRFVGATCWNEKENRLVDLRLPSMGLSGEIPDSLQYCGSINNLDLSSNALEGPIPSNICTWLPFLVTLDLSGNHLSGEIPADLLNCKFLNALRLNDNRLSGQIPYQLSRLSRLKRLSLANNRLSGPVPTFLASFDPAELAGNDGLCGRPVSSRCGGLRKSSLIIIIAAGVFGAAASLLLALAVWWWCFARPAQRRRRRRHNAPEDADWADKLRPHKFVHVSLFQKPLVKVKLADLMAATNNFDPDNIVFSSRTGVSYRAILADGSALTVKRLHLCRLSDKHFAVEMNRLGRDLRHPNLVPLLGYCLAADEKLLVYKHMAKGTLSSALHKGDTVDWPTRLRIAVGAARGLAWLHHGFQLPYLHENISSNSILLDDDFDARITDFGLARLMNSADTNGGSTLVNGDFGDFGYVAPEYSCTLVASMKGDVYGFGVVLLEFATGQKPLEVSSGDEGFKGNLVEWVNLLSGSGRIKDVIDKSLLGRGHEDQIVEFLRVACWCVVVRPKERPSMHQVYEALRDMSKDFDLSEQFDDFPLVFDKNDVDQQ